MALWRISKIEHVPGVGPANPTSTVTLIDKDTGDVKVQTGMLPVGLLGQTVETFLCQLQELHGYDPNDFNQVCV